MLPSHLKARISILRKHDFYELQIPITCHCFWQSTINEYCKQYMGRGFREKNLHTLDTMNYLDYVEFIGVSSTINP